jgi:DNA-binding LacI/PurR family transcriptional regulator
MISPIPSGRVSVKVAIALREQISKGLYPIGQFVPTIDELCVTHEVSFETARKALKVLEGEGLLKSERGHGFRVVAQASHLSLRYPLACIMGGTLEGSAHQFILKALREVSIAKGFSLLVIDGNAPLEVIKNQLEVSHPFGVLLEEYTVELSRYLFESKIPAVIIDGYDYDNKLNSVMQDGQSGGMQAVEYLNGKGISNIHWVGPISNDPHSADRLSGVLAAMQIAGTPMPPENCHHINSEKLEEEITLVLKKQKKPTAYIALWDSHAISLKIVAEKLGLIVGKDLEIVGWCTNDAFKRNYGAIFKGTNQAVLVWDSNLMIEIALQRLTQIHGNTQTPSIRIKLQPVLQTSI